jgi:hypothetical protein
MSALAVTDAERLADRPARKGLGGTVGSPVPSNALALAPVTGAVVLSEGEARELTDSVKTDVQTLWANLLALYEGDAHTALGYASWSDYCAAEFGVGRSRSYQLLNAGRVLEVIESQSTDRGLATELGSDVPREDSLPNEWQARELVPLLDNPPALVAARAEQISSAISNRMGAVTGNAEWYTPAEFTDSARVVMGSIDCDPASCEEANQTVRATTFYTKEDDGLVQPWAGTVWLNPPYNAALVKAFANKLIAEIDAGHVEQAVTLTNASTDAGWFHTLANRADGFCFPEGRIRFIEPGGNQPGTGILPQVFMYFGPRPTKFRAEFEQYGCILVRP